MAIGRQAPFTSFPKLNAVSGVDAPSPVDYGFGSKPNEEWEERWSSLQELIDKEEYVSPDVMSSTTDPTLPQMHTPDQQVPGHDHHSESSSGYGSTSNYTPDSAREASPSSSPPLYYHPVPSPGSIEALSPAPAPAQTVGGRRRHTDPPPSNLTSAYLPSQYPEALTDPLSIPSPHRSDMFTPSPPDYSNPPSHDSSLMNPPSVEPVFSPFPGSDSELDEVLQVIGGDTKYQEREMRIETLVNEMRAIEQNVQSSTPTNHPPPPMTAANQLIMLNAPTQAPQFVNQTNGQLTNQMIPVVASNPPMLGQMPPTLFVTQPQPPTMVIIPQSQVTSVPGKRKQGKAPQPVAVPTSFGECCGVEHRDSYSGNNSVIVRLLIASQSLVQEGIKRSYQIRRNKLDNYLSS